MKTFVTSAMATMLVLIAIVGCGNVLDAVSSTEPSDSSYDEFFVAERPLSPVAVPTPLATATFDTDQLTFWPYLGNDFSGVASDPVSLIFFGEADPRQIRAALLALDGDRTASGLPDAGPFNATWDDAIGDVQTAYADNIGWGGSSIQLECGDHKTVRFHLRLFRMGNATIGGAHVEVMIPGTSTHQVLSWEMAEEFVTLDLIRTGLINPSTDISACPSINASPFREIPAMIYNELPVELRGMIDGPLGDVTEDVPIANDGTATLFRLNSAYPLVAGEHSQSLVIEFGQVIPKPFCSSGPADYLYVSGPVTLEKRSSLDESGNYVTSFEAAGTLNLQPINPMTGEPIGDPLKAEVAEVQETFINDASDRSFGTRHQLILPSSADGAGKYFERLRVSTDGQSGHQIVIECTSEAAAVAEEDRLANDANDISMAPRIVRF